ncbi:MAG: hypothetical protein AB7G93_18360 [Bdellovibrionales bacterium]
MKDKRSPAIGVQELCRKLKLQLEELTVEGEHRRDPFGESFEEKARRTKLMEQLKEQLSELSR